MSVPERRGTWKLARADVLLKTGVNVHDRGALGFGLENPLEGDGVVFRCLAAHDQDGIGVF